MTTPFAIIVDFTLKPGAMDAFRRLIDSNALESCAREPGCRRFDVLVPDGEAERVVLYEIYDSRQAFDAHLKMEHFHRFDRDSASLVMRKAVTPLALVCAGDQPANSP